MKELDGEQLPRLVPPFDPDAFQREHQPLKLADYKLSDQQLEHQGGQVTVIRRAFNEKAEELEKELGSDSVKTKAEQGREKRVLSIPQHNIDGLLERVLHERRRAEAGSTRMTKKRHLKDLPSEVRAQVVRLYSEENVL